MKRHSCPFGGLFALVVNILAIVLRVEDSSDPFLDALDEVGIFLTILLDGLK